MKAIVALSAVGLAMAAHGAARADCQPDVARASPALCAELKRQELNPLPALPSNLPAPIVRAAPSYGAPAQGYGQISRETGLPRTNYVQGYYRADGTYVQPYYRSQR